MDEQDLSYDNNGSYIKDEGIMVEVDNCKNDINVFNSQEIDALFTKFHIPIAKKEAAIKKPSHLDPKFVPKLKTHYDSLDYFMGHQHRGKCIIINNSTFDSPNFPERKGTNIDGKNLTDCFKKIGFDVQNWNDKKAYDIVHSLNNLAKEDFTNHDCLVVCVLTHGETNYLVARDDKYFIDLIFKPFTANECKTLAGKPKIFIIQACRGDQLDTGSVIRYDVEDSVKDSVVRIPQWSDFLMAYSTIPGYYSWRNTSNGSWFIQAFVKTLIKYYDSLDLLSIFTIVSRSVAYNFESNCPNLPDFHNCKQIPMIASMLTRRVFFGNPKPNNLTEILKPIKLDSKTKEAKNEAKKELKMKILINQKIIDTQKISKV